MKGQQPTRLYRPVLDGSDHRYGNACRWCGTGPLLNEHTGQPDGRRAYCGDECRAAALKARRQRADARYWRRRKEGLERLRRLDEQALGEVVRAVLGDLQRRPS